MTLVSIRSSSRLDCASRHLPASCSVSTRCAIHATTPFTISMAFGGRRRCSRQSSRQRCQLSPFRLSAWAMANRSAFVSDGVSAAVSPLRFGKICLRTPPLALSSPQILSTSPLQLPTPPPAVSLSTSEPALISACRRAFSSFSAFWW